MKHIILNTYEEYDGPLVFTTLGLEDRNIYLWTCYDYADNVQKVYAVVALNVEQLESLVHGTISYSEVYEEAETIWNVVGGGWKGAVVIEAEFEGSVLLEELEIDLKYYLEYLHD